MAVFRVERTRDYTVMCNHHLKDSNLSLKAKGLLSMMLSLPDEWNYTTRGLAAICKEGVDAIGKTLKELELAGYIIRRQLRGKDGRISDTEYTIFEKPRKPSPPDTTLPDTENPYLDNPDTEAPDTDNPAQLNTKKSNTQKSNTDLSSTHSFFLPAADGMTDGFEKKAEIREQIEYDILCQQYDRMQLDELVEIMLEVAMNRSPTVKIGRDAEYPTGFVQQRFEKITSIERQGNQNKLVHVCRYVTEGTFDAYLWQTVENKQKFISQIMTSKSPVRSCEDVDATALSFAEIKALCAGDPRIKERMDLDIEVSKLKIMKADHNSKQFRLEDSLLKYFPEKIEEHKGFVRGLEADMQTLAAHPLPAEGFVGMEIRGDRLTDKENAGAALLDTCKEVKGKDPVQIGSYRGFTMSVAFDSMWKTYTLTLKGQMTHRVELGSDARGNLVRIENALDKMPERLRSVQEQLENLYNQQAAAKAEVGKPFPQEQELAAKTARLIELDMELNLDGKGQPQPEQAIAKSARPSVLDRLKAPPVHGAPEKPHKKEMEAR